QQPQQVQDAGRKKKSGNRTKRQKVSKACVFCQRSHMSCDDERPCQRCIKRNIAHLCRDKDPSTDSLPGETKKQKPTQPASESTADRRDGDGFDSTSQQRASGGSGSGGQSRGRRRQQAQAPSMAIYDNPLMLFGNDVASNEFTAINEFLNSLQRGVRGPDILAGDRRSSQQASVPSGFFLTAADPNDGTSEDKLRQIINAKYEAGFLKPYNYVSGYTRMQRFMETHMNRHNIIRILEVLNTFRPTFRTIAQSLTDIDLLLVEEGFERLLLDYDNVFNSFGVPACLWRRTGEIYKANGEFADLVGVPLSYFHEGKVCIYELMTESSTVNYWEKYGEIAFDATQKAVLTSCMLQTAASPTLPGKLIHCCFSFTLRRDKYKIPLAIAGNFMPVQPQ
ncbi:hypothetical protein DL89DRAFT_209194, partial [Linderina pennispora]